MTFQKLTPEEIRKHKGVSIPGITTVFWCHDGQGNVFLTKRSKYTRDEHGHWDPGAGSLKFGQSLEENLRRELQEEYNLAPIKTEFIDYLDVFRNNADGQPTHWLAMFFAVQVDPKKLKLKEPHMVDDSGWFKLEDLPHPMHSQFEAFIEKSGDAFKHILNSSTIDSQ